MIGLIEQPVAVPGPVLIAVAKAVTVLPTSVDLLVGSTEDTKEAQLTAGKKAPWHTNSTIRTGAKECRPRRTFRCISPNRRDFMEDSEFTVNSIAY